jgi:hypothetical protein
VLCTGLQLVLMKLHSSNPIDNITHVSNFFFFFHLFLSYERGFFKHSTRSEELNCKEREHELGDPREVGNTSSSYSFSSCSFSHSETHVFLESGTEGTITTLVISCLRVGPDTLLCGCLLMLFHICFCKNGFF